ncbi:MAG: hypothetical protein IPJ34_09455 [Myxococcales bacterium]|nr:hypothetical protein [Myxococcales bacterium]
MRTLVLALAFLVGCGAKTSETNPDDGGTDGGSDTPTSDTAIDVGVDLTFCTGAGQCAVTPITCCGTCSSPTLGDTKAVRKDKVAIDRSLTCGPTPPPCPGCAVMKLDDSIQAVCRFGGGGGGGGAPAGRCTAIDVRTEPVSACETDTDCVLRSSGCCDECAPTRDQIIAINTKAIPSWRAEVCVGDEVCSRCLTKPPPGIAATCDPATKHCRVVDLLD